MEDTEDKIYKRNEAGVSYPSITEPKKEKRLSGEQKKGLSPEVIRAIENQMNADLMEPEEEIPANFATLDFATAIVDWLGPILGDARDVRKFVSLKLLADGEDPASVRERASVGANIIKGWVDGAQSDDTKKELGRKFVVPAKIKEAVDAEAVKATALNALGKPTPDFDEIKKTAKASWQELLDWAEQKGIPTEKKRAITKDVLKDLRAKV